jgi:hypothetical protein
MRGIFAATVPNGQWRDSTLFGQTDSPSIWNYVANAMLSKNPASALLANKLIA